MSRIMIHSNAPWVPSGYGKQAAHLGATLQRLGHEVVFSAFSGLQGAPIEYYGAQVLPAGLYEFGVDVLLPHMDAVEPDLTILLMDAWKLGPIGEGIKQQPRPVAAWLPVDCTPLSHLDDAFLRGAGVRPIAMSEHGVRQLEEAGHAPLYAPHVVDRQVFRPLTPEERQGYRQGLGIADRFVIGLAAANSDAVRKGFPEQFEAFRRFHKRRPEAFLTVHSIARSTRGLDLHRLAAEIGIDPSSIRFTDTYPQISGGFDDSLMADWFGVLDVLTMCSYAEAFGVPLIEAQACGTPVVTTTGSAMAELRGPGFGVAGDEFWNHVHGAYWTRPDVNRIVRAYENAYERAGDRREAARSFTEAYDSRGPAVEMWRGIIEELLKK